MALLVKIGAEMRDFDKQLARATRDIQTIGKKMVNAGSALTKGITLPLLGVAAAALKIGADFDASMSEVAAITGATGDDFEALRNQALELGSTTKFSASEAAEAMTYLGMAGYDVNEIMGAMPGVLALAAASGTDLATTADIVSDAMTAFGMSADETTQFADLLASVSTKANTNVEMLGESFKYVAPVAGALGMSAEDTALALGLMANAGIKSSQAGTSLRSILTNLANPTDEMKTLMDELGISLTDSEGNMKSLEEIMGDLRTGFSGLSEDQQAAAAATLAGKNAMSGLLAIVNAAPEDVQKLTDATTNYEGAAQAMADTMQDNLSGQLTQLKSALEGVAIQISDILMPAVRNIVAKFQEWVGKFAALSPETKTMILKIAGLAAAIGPLLLVGGKLIIGLGKLSAAIKILKTGFLAMSGPVGAAIAIVSALVTAGVLLYQNWDVVKEKLSALWDKFSGTFPQIAAAVEEAFAKIKDFITNFSFAELLEKVKDVVSGMGERWSAFKDDTLGVFEAVKDGVKGFINMLISGLNSMISGLNKISFSLPDWDILGKNAGKSFGINIPSIPMLADGAKVTAPTLAMIGEGANNEAVLPLSRNVFAEIARGINTQLQTTPSGPEKTVQMTNNFSVRSPAEAVRELKVLEMQLAGGM